MTTALASATAEDEQELLGADVNIDRLVLDIVKPGLQGFNIVDSLLDARVKETMEGAPTLQVDIHDPDFNLLKSNVLFETDKDGDRVVRQLDVELEKGRWYELAQVKWGDASSGRGIDITLTFEHRIVADLRRHRRPKKISRSRMTRAEFVRTFAREVHRDPIRFISPELHKKQKLAPITRFDSQAEKDRNRQPGFAKHARIMIQGAPADPIQKKNLSEVLDEGERQGASHKVLVVSMMVVAQESAGKRSATNGVHVGLFQQDPKYWPGTRNPTKDAKAFFKKAIALDDKEPGISYADLAEGVQHSGQGDLYKKWKDEATKTVKAYGGSGSSTMRTRYKVYMFSRGVDGKREDSWTCAQRLAQEVNWRSFVSGKVNWYFISETDLFRSRPQLTVREDHPAVLNVSGDCDRGKSTNTMVVTVRMARWTAPAGSCVLVEGYGMDGRWLVQDVERSLFSRDGTVTLKKPSKPLPEPRPQLISESVESDTSGTKGKVFRDDTECRGVHLKEPVKQFLALAAGEWNKTIHVTTSTCHNKMTQDGNVSDHWDGHAADLGSVANKFAVGGKGGDDLAAACFRVLGIKNRAKALSYAKTGKRVNWKHNGVNYTVQVLWKYPLHFDHVHVGVRKVEGNKA